MQQYLLSIYQLSIHQPPERPAISPTEPDAPCYHVAARPAAAGDRDRAAPQRRASDDCHRHMPDGRPPDWQPPR